MKTLYESILEKLQLNPDSKVKEPEWREYINKDIFIDDLKNLDTNFNKIKTFKKGIEIEIGDILYFTDLNLLMYFINEFSDEDTGEIVYLVVQCGGPEIDKKIFIEFLYVDEEGLQVKHVCSLCGKDPQEEKKIVRFYLNSDNKVYKRFLDYFKIMLNLLIKTSSEVEQLKLFKTFNKHLTGGVSPFDFIQKKEVINRRNTK